jgi:hypothetical protein
MQSVFFMVAAIMAASSPQSVEEDNRADLTCLVASMATSANAQKLGNQGVSDTAYDTAMFYEGRLTARSPDIDWSDVMGRANAQLNLSVENAATLTVKCQDREKVLIRFR